MHNVQPDGYLAIPPMKKGSAVLVLHAWWGLNKTMRAFCDRLAQAGFMVFAPDLYHGKVVDTIADAHTLSRALDPDKARADIAQASKFLREYVETSDRGVAVIGFSLGAYFGLELSITDPKHVHSVVVFYGTCPGDYSNSRAEYLGHFAETDQYEPKEDVENTEAAIKRAGLPMSFYTYEGTGHWFFEADRIDAFNPAAANLAWERTVEFLKR